jgi:uncharacterized membrane protein YgcG
VEQLSGTFRVNGASTATVRVSGNLESLPVWAPDALVTITRDGASWFQGRVVGNPIQASGSAEGATLQLVDAWQDLEQCTYTEPWLVGNGSTAIQFSRCYLGIDETGTSIKTGAQITKAIAFAAANGVAIQAGVVPTGLFLWPTMVDTISVAEVIRQSMQAHPEWVAWIDHGTSPPTFNVAAHASLATVGHAVTDCDLIDISPVIDNVPRGVQITYVFAEVVDGTTYRSVYIDSAGITTGRRVMKAVVDLAGLSMQFQKSRIQTRHLPSNEGEMETYLRQKFPQLAAGTGGQFSVESFSKRLLLPLAEDYPDPINTIIPRLIPSSLSDVPRELVNGSIEDWMQKKVGKVEMTFSLKTPKSAPADVKDFVKRLNASGVLTVTATNATTKLYTSITQWAAGETAPAGLAASLLAAATIPQYTGEIELVADDCTGVRYCGQKVAINGIVAMVESQEWDAFSGTTRVEFGPSNQHLGAADFVDLQRRITTRPVHWISQQERASNQLGSQNHPGSKGDTVTGFNHPWSELTPSLGGAMSDSSSSSGSGSGSSSSGAGPGSSSAGSGGGPISGSSSTPTPPDPDPPPPECCPDDCIVTVHRLAPGCISSKPGLQPVWLTVSATFVNDLKCAGGDHDCYHTYNVSGSIGGTHLETVNITPGETANWPPDLANDGPVIMSAPVAGCLWVEGIIIVSANRRTGADPTACPDQGLYGCKYSFWFQLPPYCGDSSCSNHTHPE